MKTFVSTVAVAVSLITFPAAARNSTIEPTGGLTVGGALQPLVFSWDTSLGVKGSGWARGEAVTISIYGPLNSPGATPAALTLGTVTADGKGNLAGSVDIPYDGGASGPGVHIPRPGSYSVSGSGATSGDRTSTSRIEIAPATSTLVGPINWGFERGGRDGVLPGPIHYVSPERVDPEWATTWSEDLVELIGTVQESSAYGVSSVVNFGDDPGHHYAHDWNIYVLPDVGYRWLAGTKNYLALSAPGTPQAPLAGTTLIEWEAQNNGNAFSYGFGQIGLPDFAAPTAGDRVVAVGRWIMDENHNEDGVWTEIHPPRLLATLRARPDVTSTSPSRAARVDVYVSGHGGGANRVPQGLSSTLDQGGEGGGRLQDALTLGDQALYRRAGPFTYNGVCSTSACSTFVLDQIVFGNFGLHILGPVYPTAGPSAFPWGAPSSELRDINDRDYDFDVPLPHAPDGATAPRVEVITQPEHTTAVNEVITYGNLVDGLPTVAHVHLPYLGADNGMYARSLRFAWDVFSPPGQHYRVTLDRVHVTDLAGAWHMWSDVSGQWANLTNLAPALFNNHAGDTIPIGASFDVHVVDGGTIRVSAHGYPVTCSEYLFGQLFALDFYSQRLYEFQHCGLESFPNLGDPTLTLPSRPSSAGSYTLDGDHFTLDVTVQFMPGL